jgi:VanZ family protein
MPSSSPSSPGSVRRALLWLPPFVYAVAIFTVSAQSDPMPALTAAVWDKALHWIEYGGFALLLCRAFRGEGCPWLTACLLAAFVASGYAISDEWHQSMVPGRNSDVRDWVADTIGAAFGVTSYWFAARWLEP